LGQVNGKVGSLSAVCENGVQKETIVGIRAILWVERDRGEQSPVVPGHLGRSDNSPELPQKGHRRQSPLVRPCEGLKCGVWLLAEKRHNYPISGLEPPCIQRWNGGWCYSCVPSGRCDPWAGGRRGSNFGKWSRGI